MLKHTGEDGAKLTEILDKSIEYELLKINLWWTKDNRSYTSSEGDKKTGLFMTGLAGAVWRGHSKVGNYWKNLVVGQRRL